MHKINITESIRYSIDVNSGVLVPSPYKTFRISMSTTLVADNVHQVLEQFARCATETVIMDRAHADRNGYSVPRD